jgi:hypothetical protein
LPVPCVPPNCRADSRIDRPGYGAATRGPGGRSAAVPPRLRWSGVRPAPTASGRSRVIIAHLLENTDTWVTAARTRVGNRMGERLPARYSHNQYHHGLSTELVHSHNHQSIYTFRDDQDLCLISHYNILPEQLYRHADSANVRHKAAQPKVAPQPLVASVQELGSSLTICVMA